MHNQKMLRSLLAIRNAAENMQSLTQSRLPKETNKVISSNCNISIPALDLPFPSDLSAALRTLGLSEAGYSGAYRKISELVLNYQNVHSLNFQHVCRNLASLPHFQDLHLLTRVIEHMRFAYQKTYTSFLPTITEQILSVPWKQNDILKSSKAPFNNVSTTSS